MRWRRGSTTRSADERSHSVFNGAAIHPARLTHRRPKNSDRPANRRKVRCRAWPKHHGSGRTSPLVGHTRGHARLPICLSAGKRWLSSIGIVAANLRSRRLTLRRVFSHFFLPPPGLFFKLTRSKSLENKANVGARRETKSSVGVEEPQPRFFHYWINALQSQARRNSRSHASCRQMAKTAIAHLIRKLDAALQTCVTA